MIPIALLIVIILIINVLQSKLPRVLPQMLGDWLFLPECLRSLKPYDKVLVKYVLCCKSLKPGTSDPNFDDNETGLKHEKNQDIQIVAYANNAYEKSAF